MPDFLNTALTGLLSFQRALATTSHNIANVNTPGYSRQRADLATLPAQPTGAGFIGQGVEINSITRVSDQFLVEQLQTSLSEQSRLAMFESLASNVDNLLADSNAGLSGALREFSAGIQAVADDPSSSSARQVLLSQADLLVDRFRTIQNRLDGFQSEIDSRLESSVGEINSLARSISELNRAIVEGTGATGGQPPNDLLDQRDALINELAQLVSVDVVQQSDGSASVFIGNGQPLVSGLQFNELSVIDGDFGNEFPEIALIGSLGGGIVTPNLSGGVIGGLLDFQRELLQPAQNQLGQIAVGLAQQFNAQHRDGIDLNGALGGDFFSVSDPEVLDSVSNGGTASVTATISDIASLVPSDYVLSFDGANYSLTRLNNGTAVPLSGSGTSADPFVADGLSIVVTAGAAAGDRFMIRPTAAAAGDMDALITDVNGIAAAAPVVPAVRSINVGDGIIEFDQVLDVTDPALLTTVTIDFITPATYSINGSGSFAYTAGSPIDVNGYRIVIDGTPAPGDQFLVQPNFSGTGDNRNMLLLAESLTEGSLNGGTVSIEDGYGQLLTQVGTTTRQVQLNLDAQNAITQQAEQAQLSVSGVNLDEEAANLVQYQQAYQAAAQLIGVADTLFQTILGAVRR